MAEAIDTQPSEGITAFQQAHELRTDWADATSLDLACVSRQRNTLWARKEANGTLTSAFERMQTVGVSNN